MTDIAKIVNDIHHGIITVPTVKKHYECEECKDSGYTVTSKDGMEIFERCKCHNLKWARKLLERSGISREFQTKGFDNFDTKNISQLEKAKVKAIKYCQMFGEREHDRKNSIMLSGQVGSGKTHLGIAISKSLMNQGIAVVYMAYRNAVTKLKQNIIDEQGYNRELNQYTMARVLYVDDLLKGKLTDADVNIIYEIINYRYMNNLPVIISTEKSLDELIEFDEAVGSRIIEMCRGNIINLRNKELNYRLYS